MPPPGEPRRPVGSGSVSLLIPMVHRKNLLGVTVIDLLENKIRQPQTVDHPSSLARVAPIGKVFILRFEPSEIVGVHSENRFRICSKEDAVLKFTKELGGAARLATKLGLPRSEFNIHIGILAKPIGNDIQIFRPVGNVQSDKCGVRMFGDHMVALVQKRLFVGKFVVVEAPGWIMHELFITLVASIGGAEKSFGIG